MRPLLPLLGLLMAAGSLAAGPADYRVLSHFAIGGDPRFDYLRVDPASRRLYVSHGTQVDVVDADTGARIGVIGPVVGGQSMSGIHGIALVPGLGRGFITVGGLRSVVMFDTDKLGVMKVIGGLGVKPDAVEYDPQTSRIYVANGQSGGVTVIDPARGEVVATVPIEGKLEGLAFDGRGHLFVNTEDQSRIQVIDTATLKPIASWPIAPVEGGTGLAIDAAHHRLFSAGGNGKLAVVDSDTGAVVATPEIGEDPDGDAFDAERGLIYTSNRPGTVTILHEDTPDTYSLVQTVATEPGARTISLDSRTGRIFLPTGKFLPAAAPTAEAPHPWPKAVPGSFEVLVVGAP